MNALLRSASVLALTAAALAASAQNLVQNGGFETGDFTNYTLTATGNGQGYISNNGVTFPGNYATFINDPVTLSQTFATSTGQSYRFEFDVAYTGNFGVTTGTSGPNSFVAQFDGAPRLTVTNAPYFNPDHYVFTVVGTGSDTINFAVTAGTGYYRLDNVSVTSVNPTPEPSALAALSLGAVAFLKRRKRA